MTVLFTALVVGALSSHSVAPDTAPCCSIDSMSTLTAATAVTPVDTQPRRRRAVEYSDWYSRRLTIHRIGSYTMLPLFGAEYVLGNQLIHGNEGSGMKPAHVAVATGIGALFTVNTVTGLWNLWDSRSDPTGRTRRTVHAISMLAADVGFVWTGAIADNAKRSNSNARQHRNVALGSIGVGTIGTAMMWFWKNSYLLGVSDDETEPWRHVRPRRELDRRRTDQQPAFVPCVLRLDVWDPYGRRLTSVAEGLLRTIL
jgi:hypothetical protein